MRILAVNWRCPKNPLAGGAEVYFQEIFSRLVSRGHHVTLLSERFPGSEPEDVIETSFVAVSVCLTTPRSPDVAEPASG